MKRRDFLKRSGILAFASAIGIRATVEPVKKTLDVGRNDTRTGLPGCTWRKLNGGVSTKRYVRAVVSKTTTGYGETSVIFEESDEA